MTHFRTALVFCAALAPAQTAHAQGNHCSAVWQLAFDVIQAYLGHPIEAPEGATSVSNSACEMPGLNFETTGPMAVHTGMIRWSGDGWTRLTTSGLPPVSAEIAFHDIRFLPVLDDPVFSYLFREQSATAGFDVEFAAHWVEEADQVEVTKFRADFPGQNSVEFRMLASGIDLTDSATLQASAATGAVDEVWLKIQTNGLFESHALMPLGGALLVDSQDPEADVADMKRQAEAAVSALPDEQFPRSSRAALIAMIRDVPHPKGDIEVHMRAEPGLSVARYIGLARDPDFDITVDFWHLLDGVQFDITYVQTEPPD